MRNDFASCVAHDALRIDTIAAKLPYAVDRRSLIGNCDLTIFHRQLETCRSTPHTCAQSSRESEGGR